MIVVFDASMLSLLFHPTARIPDDPITGRAVSRPRDRIAHLVGELSQSRATIIIPTPALTEFLVVVEEAGPKFVQMFEKHSRFSIEPYDTAAAIEAARMYKHGRDEGDWKLGAEGPRQKVKIDHQIVAIAQVKQASRIYTTDKDIRNIAGRRKISAIAVWDLPLPAEEPDLFTIMDLTSEPASSSAPVPPSARSPDAEKE